MALLKERPIRKLVEFIYAHPYGVFLGALLLAVAMGLMAVKVPGRDGPGLELKSSIQDLLPESAPSVQAMHVLESRLGSADMLVVTLMTNDFDRVKKELGAIAEALEAEEDILKVEWKLDIDVINKNALTIFATLDELKDYYDELTDAIREAVSKSLQLFDDDKKEGSKSERFTYSWAELEQDDGLSNMGRSFRKERGNYREYFYNRAYTTIGLQVYPTKSSNNLAFCRHILDLTDKVVRREVESRLGPVGEGQVVTRIDLGGGYRSALEQSDQIASDVVSSAGITLFLLSMVMIIWFRSVRAFFCVMVPLLFGTAWTIGLVSISVGYLNLITAFIFAVLLGLGIDFGIHYYGRYREERAAGMVPLEAMVITHLECGEASVLACLTTTFAFFALTLADFKGFSQFGAVAGAGVLLCVLAVMVVFTSLTFIFERIRPLKLKGYKVDRDAAGDVRRHRFPLGARTALFAVAIALAGMISGVSTIGFEMDFRKLGEKNTGAKKDYEEIQYGTSQATSPAVIFATSEEEARSLYKQLDEKVRSEKGNHPRIKSFQTLFSLVPDQQEEKAKWVKKICRKLGRKVKLFEGDQRDGADELLSHCNPETFGVDDLPDWVKAKFSDKDGKLGEFIFVSPRGSTNDGEVALGFHKEMMTLKGLDGKAPVVSGKPMIWADVLMAMMKDGLLTGLSALLTVLLLVAVFERNVAGVAMIMMPLTMGLSISAGVMVLFGIKLNFFNMLAIPTMIGMGVDNAIHIYHRHKVLGAGSIGYIVRTTGSSAMLSSITTMIGFASLLTANHLGLNSLGTLTIVGMSATLISSLCLLTAALQWFDDVQERRKKAAQKV